MAKGEFLAANLMVAMIPEEVFIEKAFEDLSAYKVAKDCGVDTEPPVSALMALIMK